MHEGVLAVKSLSMVWKKTKMEMIVMGLICSFDAPP